MGKQKPPPGPDYDRLLELTEIQIAANEKLFSEFMDFQGEQFDFSKEVTQRVLDTMQPAMEAEAAAAARTRERYEELGIPFEDEYVKKLQDYDSPARTEKRAASAVSDVSMALSGAREAELQRLESFGIDPSQTRSAALDTRMQTQAALAKAAAANTSRVQSEGTGLALGGEAVNIMRGLPGQVAQGYATAQGAGGTASGTALGQAQLGNQGYQIGAGIQGQGSNMLNNGYNTANNIYGNQLRGYQIQQENSFGAGLGSILGAVLPAASGAGGFGALLGFDDGGYVPPDVSPSRGAIPDDVNAALTGGEYIIDDSTVRYHGLKTLAKLQKEARENMPAKQPMAPPKGRPVVPAPQMREALPMGGA